MSETDFERAERLQKELEKTQRQLRETRFVLTDFLAERGKSWLGQLEERREQLLMYLRWAVVDDLEYVGRSNHCGGCDSNDCHARNCGLACVMRIVGGEAEVQRQVDAAHEAALEYHWEPTTRTLSWPYGICTYGPNGASSTTTWGALFASAPLTPEQQEYLLNPPKPLPDTEK